MAEIKRYTTPVFRISFPCLFEAESYDGGPPKFGCSAVWDLSRFTTKDKQLWKILKGALNAESLSRFNKKWKELPQNIKRGLRDGDEKADMEGYGAGTKFASLSTKMKPGVINKDKDAISAENGNLDEMYPGCYCRATVTVYSYDNKGKGVAIGLMNIQKVADGARLDSRTDAAEDFDDEIDDQWMDEDESLLDDDDDLDDEIPF